MTGVYVPVEQLVQVRVPVAEYFPSAQASHAVCTEFTTLPASQLLQMLLPVVIYLPAAHWVHAVGGELGACPAEQFVHDVAPVVVEYVPLVHVVQVVAPAPLDVPALQDVQEDEPMAAYVPALQDEQEEAAATLSFPPSQFVQHADPVVGPANELYLPAVQDSQAVADVPGAVVDTMYFPAAHAVQVEVTVYVPSPQRVQADNPAVET